MVYLLPPHSAAGQRSYAEVYGEIISAHRRSPSASASSVVMLVAPNVDALCASRMLAYLFKQDDVGHRIVPVSGIDELETLKDELNHYTELRTLILLGMASFLQLTSSDWFGDFSLQVTIHVIDSTRPQNLANLFQGGENGERIIVWDDGEVEKLEEEKKAWEALQYEPETFDSDNSDDSEHDYEEDDVNPNDDSDGDESDDEPKKRKSTSRDDRNSRKRRRINDAHRMPREERLRFSQRLAKHYMSGVWHGQSVSGVVYVLATILERADNDFLWLAILGLTYQYTTSRISRDRYEAYHSVFYDEVSRLNPYNDSSTTSLTPDDVSIRATEELRFTLFRHWTLYDAMYHSNYIANKIGIWKERGRKRLTGLLAKMGFSIPQTQQPYAHMDMDLKKALTQKLSDVAPEYGLVELTYPSFIRCYGYYSQPFSAADAVEGISALLDVAGGVRLEVEVEGSRNGGEWFGGGKIWEAGNMEKAGGSTNTLNASKVEQANTAEEAEGSEHLPNMEVKWWVRNFWIAYDSLTDIRCLRDALNLSMSLHRAIIRQGTSIIEKQDIRTMRNHRVVILTQGPDLALFAHPGVLSRLALWLVDALRDRIPGSNVSTRSKRQSLPFVVASLDENTGKYIVVGVMAALDFGDVRKNEFGVAFLDARDRCNAVIRHASFDTTVLEIEEKDLKPFLEALCEGPTI
ncbi:CDC45 family [Cyathus striatus]|nr:CDC45 family [Cyathus striatus]